MKLDGSKKNFRVTKLFDFIGLKRLEINEAEAGDLIAVSGMEDINVGETVADAEHPEAITPLRIDPPTLQMTFSGPTILHLLVVKVNLLLPVSLKIV